VQEVHLSWFILCSASTTIVCLFVFFSVTTVLSVSRFTTSDYLFGDFSHEIPQTFSRLPTLGAIFFKCAPLTRNPGSAPGSCVDAFNDTKEVIRSRKSTDRQYSGHRKKYKKANNGRRSTT
jgi:hypothetical protein